MSSKYLLSEKQNLLNHIGLEQAWGWSPAIDFCSLLEGRLPLPLGTGDSRPNEKRDHIDPTLAVKESMSAKGGNEETADLTPKSKDELEFELLLQGVKLDRRVKGKPQALSSSGGTFSSPENEDEQKTKKNSTKETGRQPKEGSHSGAGREAHILLAGANDIRHVLRTISQVRLKEREEVEKRENERKKEAIKKAETTSDASSETNENMNRESMGGRG